MHTKNDYLKVLQHLIPYLYGLEVSLYIWISIWSWPFLCFRMSKWHLFLAFPCLQMQCHLPSSVDSVLQTSWGDVSTLYLHLTLMFVWYIIYYDFPMHMHIISNISTFCLLTNKMYYISDVTVWLETDIVRLCFWSLDNEPLFSWIYHKGGNCFYTTWFMQRRIDIIIHFFFIWKYSSKFWSSSHDYDCRLLNISVPLWNSWIYYIYNRFP